MKSLPLTCLFLLGCTLAFAQKHADCDKAMDICKKQTYTIDRVSGEGSDNREADMIACFMSGENFGQAEENSTWIKFEIAKGGTLKFVITPQRYDDDMDFVVFKLPASGDCKYKQIVRCMASGERGELAHTSPCMGNTGLRDGEKDSSEDAGCNDEGDNAWLAPLKVEKGEKYVVLVSNVSSSGPGFSITFSGSAMLPCDEEKKTPPIADKPKDKPKEIKVPKPEPAAPATAMPATIGGREVSIGETVTVKNKKLKIKIWDSQVEDGDIISIYLNDKKIIDHVALRRVPQEFDIDLPPGKENFLTVYADDFGKAEPNTAKVSVNDGVHEQVIDLVAGRKKQDSIKIITD